MIYKINNQRRKEWNGKTFVEAELIDSNGEAFKVSAWNGEFDNRENIDTALFKNDKGYWTLPKPQRSYGGANQPSKTASIEKIIEKKNENISHFQDSKEQSIKLASTIRMAVDVATALTPDQWQGTTMQEEIRFWRKWFLNEWELKGDRDLDF